MFERRSCGTGTEGPRIGDWALIATGRPREFLLIRRLLSRPDHAQATAGLITLAFALRWSVRRRRHQATSRWHHHSARLLAAAT